MWVSKEKIGDNSLDFVAVPRMPPATPPLATRVRPRRSSLREAIQWLKSGPSAAPGGGGGVGQDRADECRVETSERAGGREGAAATAVAMAAVGVSLSSSGETGSRTESCTKLEECSVGRRQDGGTSAELLDWNGPRCGGPSLVAGVAGAAEAASGPARQTTTRDGGGDGGGEGNDGSGDSLSRDHTQRKRLNLEKIFSSSTDLSLWQNGGRGAGKR